MIFWGIYTRIYQNEQWGYMYKRIANVFENEKASCGANSARTVRLF